MNAAIYDQRENPDDDRPYSRRDEDGASLHVLPNLNDEQQFRSAFDDAAIGMSIATLNFRLLRVNAAHSEMLGYSEEELLKTDFRTRIHPDDLAPNDQLRADLFAGRINSYAVERRYIHKLGHIVWCIVTVSLVRDAHGRPQYFVGQMQDISERKRAESQLRASEQRMAQVLASSSDGILIVDRCGRVTSANTSLARIAGISVSGLIGRTSSELPWAMRKPDGSSISGDEQPITHALLTQTVVSGQEVEFVHPDGRLVYTTVDAVPLIDPVGQLDGAVMTVHDVTEQKTLERQLARLALHDTLTGLPNRRHFESRAEQALVDARRDSTAFSIVFIDLDGFKPINDQYGHLAGDQVLTEVAQRLVDCMGDGGFVARMGGDEFAILLGGPDVAETTDTVATRITAACAAPHLIDGSAVYVTPSIGIGATCASDDRLGDVLHRADSAMYVAKRAQRTQRRRSTDAVTQVHY